MSFDYDLPTGWCWSTLDEVRAAGRSVVSGPFGSNIGKRFFVETGVPVIRGNNLTTNMSRFHDGGFVYLTEEKAKEFTSCEAVADDLIFTAAGTIGQVGLIPRQSNHSKYIISNKQLRARLNTEVIDPVFAYYWFASPPMVKAIQSRNTGSTIPLINLSVLKSLPIVVPPLDEQHAIAGYLSLLDDRITLLRETNATLEAIAQALFKSWFVDFDPVRAKMEGRAPEGMDEATAALFPDSFEETELGAVPRGWKLGTLGDVAQTARSQVQPDAMHSALHYVGLEHIPRKCLSLNDWGTAEGLESAKSCFAAGDILFGKLRPYFHKVVVAPMEGVCSTDILVCRSTKPEYYGFVVMQLFSETLVTYADRLSNGAKMPRVNWKDLAAYELVVPAQDVAEAFTAAVQPLLNRKAANVFEAQTLATLRDTLLPRLISGQLRLPEAQAELEAA